LLLVHESSKSASLTFSGNNIIEAIVTGELLLNKGADDVLVTMREDKPGECILAPAYRANIVNIELG
jgi:hypothetical protein